MYSERRSSPVSEGDVYDVTIEDIASKGDGLTRIDGFVVFVPNTNIGEKVSIKITKVMRNFAIGEVE